MNEYSDRRRNITGYSSVEKYALLLVSCVAGFLFLITSTNTNGYLMISSFPHPMASLTPGVALHAKRPGQQDGSVHSVPASDKQPDPCVGAERVRACSECFSVPAVSLFALTNA